MGKFLNISTENRLFQKSIPVGLIGSGLTLLGTVRSLAKVGIETYCISSDSSSASSSRFFHSIKSYQEGDLSDHMIAHTLEMLPWKQIVLMPCSDKWIPIISKLSRENPTRYLSSLPPPEQIDNLVDKAKLYDLLKELKIPHPFTADIDSEQQLEDLPILDYSRFFLKPRESQAFFNRYCVKAYRVKSREDAINILRKKTQDGFQMLIQEYIPGSPELHFFLDGFVDSSGEVCAMFARKRLRMYPPDFGNSTYMISVPLENVSQADNHLRNLLSATNYRGIFSVEFKLDERDNHIKLIEINVRPWWYIEFATSCGVNVGLMAYRDALGLPVETVNSYKINRKFVYPYYDYNARSRDNKNGMFFRLEKIKQWIGANYPYFRYDDPMPAIWCLTKRVKCKLKKWFTRV